jgi:hypothetical protein
VPVLVGGAFFEGSGNEGVAFVLDLSEQKRAEDKRKRAEEALQKAQAELLHLTRGTTLGELTTSIAHEINQLLAAVVNNAGACLRWLAAQNLVGGTGIRSAFFVPGVPNVSLREDEELLCKRHLPFLATSCARLR